MTTEQKQHRKVEEARTLLKQVFNQISGTGIPIDRIRCHRDEQTGELKTIIMDYQELPVDGNKQA